jgi:polar amino acid transport system substrate-binding protein
MRMPSIPIDGTITDYKESKVKLRTVALASVVLALLSGIALADDTIATVKKNGFLVAGVRDADPPFGFKEEGSGKIVGLDIDLARAVAKKMGVKLRLKPVKAGERVPALLDGSIDLIAAKMAKSPERAGLVDFSATYFTATRRILMKKGMADNGSRLEGKRIAIVAKSGSAKTVANRYPASVPVPFGDYQAAAAALENGEVDALAGDGLILYGLLAALPEDEYAIPETFILSEQEYALAVRKGDKDFLAIVNQSLDELKRSGKAKRIMDKWLRPRSADAPAGIASAHGMAGQASGVVVRRAAAPGRFLVMAVNGMFRPDSEVSFYEPNGKLLGRGSVFSLYDDEVYVDLVDVPGEKVAIGDAVMMNYPEGVASRDVKDRQDFLLGVKASVREEDQAR